MSSTESKLMWVAIALSLILVLALGTLAVYSVLGQDADTGSEADSDRSSNAVPVTVSDDQAPAAPELVARQLDPGLSVSCERSSETDSGYAVIIVNRGTSAVDYVVSIELTVEGARPLVASTEILDLSPGERREVIVNAAGPSGRRISGCSIAAVQSDRRVLLANS